VKADVPIMVFSEDHPKVMRTEMAECMYPPFPNPVHLRSTMRNARAALFLKILP